MGADTFSTSWSLRFRRLLRRIGFDRNPMRRGTDRIQAITDWLAVEPQWTGRQ